MTETTAPAPVAEPPAPVETETTAPAPVVPVAEVEVDPKPKQDPKPHVGETIFYTGDESNGTVEHPAIVTRINEDGTINATVFFDGSAPAARKELKFGEGWDFEQAKEAPVDGVE